jgi:hypothetical protein
VSECSYVVSYGDCCTLQDDDGKNRSNLSCLLNSMEQSVYNTFLAMEGRGSPKKLISLTQGYIKRLNYRVEIQNSKSDLLPQEDD